MIIRSIFACCLLLSLNTPAFSETDKYISTKAYVPENRLEKLLEVPEGDVYVVRGNVRSMDNFVELWARITLRNNDQETLDMWNNENVIVNSMTGFAHLKLHFYCKTNEAAIPAVYIFNKWSEMIDSKVVMIDEPFTTKNKPVLHHLKELACNGKMFGFQ